MRFVVSVKMHKIYRDEGKRGCLMTRTSAYPSEKREGLSLLVNPALIL